MAKAFISGCSDTVLTADERAFFSAERPWGLILFARNIRSHEQVRDLVADWREAVGDAQAPVLIDQEGGRVRRLRPPLVADYPAGEVYGRLHAQDREAGLRMAWAGARLIAADLADLGITVDCAPILDVPASTTSDVIGDRAYARDPETIAAIGRAVADGLLAGGVLPVIKHIPGHGRATVDSHLELPVVDASARDLRAVDFIPFKALADLPLGMTAHIVFTALDGERCATQSPVMIDLIRSEIGFDGALMADDVSMKALGGEMGERVEKLFAAGCDLALHCNGEMVEMRSVADAAPELAGEALRRCSAALARRRDAEPLDRTALRAEFEDLLARGRHGA
ncbi:MAG: beta-N-acetylhexosaminidase [Stappia sp.]|uniref:beta-N-acetylhexosaminidase n=1 Tax=Stappia sp. TaxID=1870903 RepID=UPI000C68C3F2|nr:beta-N-acetylhexosaminidase [Stappia sp.]MBM21719.1 beta-N-acetylhexosaminidase [Stappia sp.]